LTTPPRPSCFAASNEILSLMMHMPGCLICTD
jgi:hypothetical protein